MNCREFKELAAAYALDALDADERRACDAHLAASDPHEGCREHVAAYRRVATALAWSAPVEPLRPEIAARIEKRVEVPGVTPLVPRDAGHTQGPRRLWASPAFAYAIAALALLALVFVLRGRQQMLVRLEAADRLRDADHAELTRANEGVATCKAALEAIRVTTTTHRDAVATLSRPGATAVPIDAVPGKSQRAVVIASADGRRLFVMSSDFEAMPGKDFQLWTVRGTQAPEPAGFLRPIGDGLAVGEIDPARVAAGMPDAVAISLEPTGGRPTPTEVLAFGRLRS